MSFLFNAKIIRISANWILLLLAIQFSTTIVETSEHEGISISSKMCSSDITQEGLPNVEDVETLKINNLTIDDKKKTVFMIITHIFEMFYKLEDVNTFISDYEKKDVNLFSSVKESSDISLISDNITFRNFFNAFFSQYGEKYLNLEFDLKGLRNVLSDLIYFMEDKFEEYFTTTDENKKQFTDIFLFELSMIVYLDGKTFEKYSFPKSGIECLIDFDESMKLKCENALNFCDIKLKKCAEILIFYYPNYLFIHSRCDFGTIEEHFLKKNGKYKKIEYKGCSYEIIGFVMMNENKEPCFNTLKDIKNKESEKYAYEDLFSYSFPKKETIDKGTEVILVLKKEYVKNEDGVFDVIFKINYSDSD